MSPRDGIERAAELLRSRGDRAPPPVVAFTGAGISTESGIPDFRSPGGVWARNRPVQYDEFMAKAEARYEYWRQKAISHGDMHSATPNAGHRILARWEERGLVRAVITQNIDGLHQAAGSRKVLELHGTAREIACQDCGGRWPADPLVRRFLDDDRVPDCEDCGGRLKHATVSFGQVLPRDVLEESWNLASGAGIFLAVGSSLVVEPAASLPRAAAGAGADLILLNRDPTPLDAAAAVVLRAEIGETLEELDRRLGQDR